MLYCTKHNNNSGSSAHSTKRTHQAHTPYARHTNTGPIQSRGAPPPPTTHTGHQAHHTSTPAPVTQPSPHLTRSHHPHSHLSLTCTAPLHHLWCYADVTQMILRSAEMITCYCNSCKNINRNTVKINTTCWCSYNRWSIWKTDCLKNEDRMSEEQMQSVDHLMSIHLNTVKMNLAVKIFWKKRRRSKAKWIRWNSRKTVEARWNLDYI